MFGHKSSTLGAAFAVAAPVLAFGGHAAAAEHVIVLIDQSGSMLEDSVAGAPRWVVARQLAADAVAAAAGDREYALWTFTNSSFTNVLALTDHATQDQVIDEIWNLPSPGGSTPLAGSICDAIDTLIAYKPFEFNDKRVELFSDGLENSTLSTHKCYGPNSANHASPDPGSWEWKVFNMARTGNPLNSGSPSLPLLINADYLFEHEPAFVTLSAPAPVPAPFRSITAAKPVREVEVVFDQNQVRGIDKLPPIEQTRLLEKLRIEFPSPIVRSQVLEGITPSATLINAPALALVQSQDFFKKLTVTSTYNGRYRAFSKQNKRLPQLGDVTGDFCVDDADVAAVKAQWGATVPAGSAIDPNQDKKVDYYDYLTVMQNFGDGCNRR